MDSTILTALCVAAFETVPYAVSLLKNKGYQLVAVDTCMGKLYAPILRNPSDRTRLGIDRFSRGMALPVSTSHA
jgi:hypothetical protein